MNGSSSPLRSTLFFGLALGVASSLLAPTTARAIPAFARKYGTSCATCHTVFPKLNPFGEAFRRNGYRFPGTDSDNVQQETVTLSQEAYKKLFPHALWPSSIAASVPIAVGFNGAAIIHPDKNSAASEEDNKTAFTLQNLVEEGQIWAGGSFTDYTTFFGELAFSEDGVEVEHGAVLFNDLVGPAHAVNLVVGKNMPWLNSFGMHSTYLADMAIPMVMVAGLYGGQDETWSVAAAPPAVEVDGVLGGRFDYSAGVNAGVNADIRPSDNFYGHIGAKLGGVRLDGEGGSTVANAQKPWAETALTLDAFAYGSDSHFVNAADETQRDRTFAYGGALRGQLQSFELNAGLIAEHHNHATATREAVDALTQYDELSYVVFPWLVPAARFEYVHLNPTGGQAASHINIRAGVDALIFANLKLSLIGSLEQANGSPMAGMGWMDTGVLAPDPGTKAGLEFETIELGLAYAL